MMHSKRLMRARITEELHKVNEAECKAIEERMQSEECLTAILQFYSKRSKM
jgi:peroxisomal 3,2-trans-enoyl-CoA isomerase